MKNYLTELSIFPRLHELTTSDDPVKAAKAVELAKVEHNAAMAVLNALNQSIDRLDEKVALLSLRDFLRFSFQLARNAQNDIAAYENDVLAKSEND